MFNAWNDFYYHLFCALNNYQYLCGVDVANIRKLSLLVVYELFGKSLSRE